MSRNRGRPRKPLPHGIGEYSDAAVAEMSTLSGRKMSKERVRALRNEHKIGKAPLTTRQGNQYDRD